MQKTWFITGATRGIGAEIVRAALAAGDRVAATGRDPGSIERAFPDSGDRLLPLPLDVTRRGEIEVAVERALDAFDRIDVLVNNAGYGHLGLFEETAADDAVRQFATNVFGLFDVSRAVLPTMRRQRSGHIFNLSSVAGIRGGVGGSLYCASKFAVEGFSESLSLEVEPFGIHVTLVEPGFFRTDFLDQRSVRFAGHAIEDYAELSARVRDGYEARNHRQAGDPAKLAAILVELAGNGQPPRRFVAGSDAIEILAAKIARLTGELEATRILSATTDGSF